MQGLVRPRTRRGCSIENRERTRRERRDHPAASAAGDGRPARTAGRTFDTLCYRIARFFGRELAKFAQLLRGARIRSSGCSHGPVGRFGETMRRASNYARSPRVGNVQTAHRAVATTGRGSAALAERERRRAEVANRSSDGVSGRIAHFRPPRMCPGSRHFRELWESS